MRFLLYSEIDRVDPSLSQIMGNLTTKINAAHLKKRVRRFILLGCGFSLSGLRYPLRKPNALCVFWQELVGLGKKPPLEAVDYVIY